MKQFAVKPEIFMCDTCKEFCDEYKIGKGDLILSNEYIFEPYFSQYVSGATVVYVEKYGTGEPSDEMVEAIYADIKNCYSRLLSGAVRSSMCQNYLHWKKYRRCLTSTTIRFRQKKEKNFLSCRRRAVREAK